MRVRLTLITAGVVNVGTNLVIKDRWGVCGWLHDLDTVGVVTVRSVKGAEESLGLCCRLGNLRDGLCFPLETSAGSA